MTELRDATITPERTASSHVGNLLVESDATGLSRRRIAVAPSEYLDESLCRALAELYQVQFVAAGASPVQVDAAILFQASEADADSWSRAGVRTLAFLGGHEGASNEVRASLSFCKTEAVSPYFAGADLTIHALLGRAINERGDDKVLARCQGRAVWVRRNSGGAAADVVAVHPSRGGPSQRPFTRFESEEAPALTPLLQLLQEVSGWIRPRPRACVMVDDPNLHWRTYGYVDYHAINEHARLHDYHIAFATIPLDFWYVHQPTARLFKENTRRLSLLIHGNDHTHYELQRPRSAEERLSILTTALQRTARLERTSQLRVCRVMAAPHAACSEAMARSLRECAFDAACISRGALMARNPDVAWPETVGLNTTEFLGGLPIIPRFNLRADASIRVRVAAMLGQPIIPVGHHDDLCHGLAILAAFAAEANALPDVRWCNMSEMAESNFHWSREGDTLTLRPFSRRIRVSAAEGIRRLRVFRPWLDSDGDENLSVETVPAAASGQGNRPDAAAGTMGGEWIITSHVPDVGLAGRPRRSGIGAILRRQMAEGRDRLRPLISNGHRWHGA